MDGLQSRRAPHLQASLMAGNLAGNRMRYRNDHRPVVPPTQRDRRRPPDLRAGQARPSDRGVHYPPHPPSCSGWPGAANTHPGGTFLFRSTPGHFYSGLTRLRGRGELRRRRLHLTLVIRWSGLLLARGKPDRSKIEPHIGLDVASGVFATPYHATKRKEMKIAAYRTATRGLKSRLGCLMPLAGGEALKTSMAAVVLAIGIAMIWPAQAEAQLQCAHCHQSQINYGDGPIWIHWFDLDSTMCDEWPDAEMCRACGGSSECHDQNPEDDDVLLGKCHQPCAPAFVLRDLDRAVTVLAANVDSQTGPILAGRVAEETSLVYDASGNAVELIGCEGVLKRWTLAESARSYFAAHHKRVTVDLDRSPLGS